MDELTNELNKVEIAFDVTKQQMLELAHVFFTDMSQKNSLKMLQTYIYCRKSVTEGQFISLDFGGSNVRIFLFEFSNENKPKVISSINISLKGNDFDFTTEKYTLRDIFTMVAEKMEEIIPKDRFYLLGHTFSFPICSTSQNAAIILGLTKGFRTKEAIGQDVNLLLKEILSEKGFKIEPIVILNDTTATLLSGQYLNRDTDIACIVGTGHNICFMDKTGEAINTEAGGFREGIPLNGYDLSFLETMPLEKNNVMEALVGGKYIGLLADEIMKFFIEQRLIEPIEGGVTAKLVGDAADGIYNDKYSKDQNIFLQRIGKIIYRRAAKLVVAEIMGILQYRDPDLLKEHNIVFDGSVYERTSYFRECITAYLKSMYGKKAALITHSLIKDGSGLGAAIAAAANYSNLYQ